MNYSIRQSECEKRISEIKSAINKKYGGSTEYLDVIKFALNHVNPLNPMTVEEFLSDWELTKFFYQTMKVKQEDIKRNLLGNCPLTTMLRHPATKDIDITQVACDLEANAKAPKPFDKAPGVGC